MINLKVIVLCGKFYKQQKRFAGVVVYNIASKNKYLISLTKTGDLVLELKLILDYII